MIKIAALNKELEEENRCEDEVTKEALEQIALQQYAKALELQRKGNIADATQLLKDLLDTELLDNIKKPSQGEKITTPLFNLKYLCYKNLASFLSSAGEVDDAINAYCSAAELDDTDVTLWYRLGMLCRRGKRFEMALQVFQRGTERNPKHWPCIDNIITLLLGLDCREECISQIHEALQLDPGYLRGLVYRRHIFTTHCYIRDFMEYLSPEYKWNEQDDEPIDEERAVKLLKEAEDINEIFVEQQKAEQLSCNIPIVKMNKPITKLTWESVGESLVDLHNHLTEKFFSHACPIDVVFEKEKDKTMEVCVETEIPPVEKKVEENQLDASKTFENVSENEMKDNEVIDLEKAESDVEVVTVENNTSEPKRKPSGRRRGSDLSFLEQWEWCNKRRSRRKKPVNRQDRLNDNIYDTLRRMVPLCLAPELIKKSEEISKVTSSYSDLDKTCEDKQDEQASEINTNFHYFGSDDEQKDVEQFINKYTENRHDIIDMLKEYLYFLALKWKIKWPDNLTKIFIEANKCYNNHIDIPMCSDYNHEELLHYTIVNLLAEELYINQKLLNTTAAEKQTHDITAVEAMGMALTQKPHIFVDTDILEMVLRQLWVKFHILILNKREECALDCLYQLQYEFTVMDEHCSSYSLDIVNFTFKPIINDHEITEYIKFVERNKKLEIVHELYDRGNYEEVLTIVIDSFEHCKNMAKEQEEEMSLDFAVQLSLILDTFWALDKVASCFKWSLICLHEALKHYFRFTSGSPDYDKWTLTVVKILSSMEHILTTEDMSCFEFVTQKELSYGLEDLIRIIGHQVETNTAEMPFGSVAPWIIMHYILQREEDQGRGRIDIDSDKVVCDEVPNALMVLFIAHEQLGSRGWCCKSDAKLLYFILDTVVPRLRSPSLSKSLEQVFQHMEQCVYCLYGHPGRKNKIKYLVDHNVTAHTLDWKRAQQLYEIFRPPTLPELEGKNTFSADTEQLFLRILDLMPAQPQKYVPDIEKYIKGVEDKLPLVPPILPYKMKDIYFLLGDYYFKKDDLKLAIKYNMYDIIVNNDRLESWAEISLAKVSNLTWILNSCKNLNSEKELLNPAKSIIRCFKRSLHLDPSHITLWIEYGNFVYTIHSFCSRVLKSASESLSMEDFESLERQKENMLDTTQKCFTTVLGEHNNSNENEKANEDLWLQYYMLGKVAEKRNKPPHVYLAYYIRGIKSLTENEATYPLKINYSSPTRLCIEVLELHYRIHASILKYIEQHENKPIPTSVGKVFASCIKEWKEGHFMKKLKKDGSMETESEPKSDVHAANILKRSISDAGEEDTRELKKLKLESAAAKVKRSVSYDTERVGQKDMTVQNESDNTKPTDDVPKESVPVPKKQPSVAEAEEVIITSDEKKPNEIMESEIVKSSSENNTATDVEKKSDSSSSSSSSSSSGTSSSESSSGTSSESSRDSDTSSKSVVDKPLTDDEIMKIVADCLDALEDCASRFPPHYKAIYRLAHYHFYYKKGKDIGRCRDLMLSTFVSRNGQKLGGLFSERKHSNFFNNIWKIPLEEVERAGGFAFHMNRAVLLTMEILKEIDDHQTLLDLSMYLQRIPEPDKTYLRTSDREELAQQAFSLCVQSLKGQLLKFSQQADLKSNEVERQALKSLMLDINRAYQRAQKLPNSKLLTNLLADGYKLITTTPITENMNLVDLSLRYCQSLQLTAKQQATQASLEKAQNAQKRQSAKAAAAENAKASSSYQPKMHTEAKAPTVAAPTAPSIPTTSATSAFPNMSAHEVAAALQSFLPILNDPQLAHQAATAISNLTKIMAFANYSQPQPSTLQNSFQSSYQADLCRQILAQSYPTFNPPPPKKKRGPKPASAGRPMPPNMSQLKNSKSFTSTSSSAPMTSNLQKSMSAPSAPSMGTVLPSLPPSIASLSTFGAPHSSQSLSHSHTMSTPVHAHMSSTSTVNAAIHTKPPMPHQQVSPGKTLQEKLAERQKNLPSISKNSKDISASISKLPSSLTITKSSVPKQPVIQGKKSDSRKALPFGETGSRPKPITSDEVIVLDDD